MNNETKRLSRIRLTAGLICVAILAALIGCGGGGGGGSTIGGTNSTDGGNNNGGNDNGGNDNGGNNGGSDNGGTPGVLPPNKVFYSVLNAADTSTEIWYTDPKPESEGGVKTKFATLPNSNNGPSFVAFAPHPTVQNTFFFAYQASPTADIGIYRATSLNVASATQIVPPTYSSITHLQLSPDGSTLAYVASIGGGGRKLYKAAASGTSAPVLLDDADQTAVSPSGDLIVYSKQSPLLADLFARPLKADGDARQLTNTGDRDETYPAISRNGQRVVFSAGPTFAQSDLYTLRVSDGGDEQRLTQTPNLLESGASFNSDGTRVAYAAYSDTDARLSGLYIVNATGGSPVQIVSDYTIGFDVYWTSDNGRGIGGLSAAFKLHLAPRHKPK